MDTFSEILKELSSLASTKLLIAVVTAVVVVIVGKLVMRFLNRAVTRLKIDPTLHKFLMAVCKVVIYFIAIMIVAGSLGFEMSSLVALASVISAAFALAASGMLSNLFGGILLLLTKPFGVGDYIAVSGEEGFVQEIGILNTKINTLDNKRITMPNSSVSATTIVNYSKEGKRRVDMTITVGYENDIEAVKAALVETARNHPLVVDADQIFCRVLAYNDYNIAFAFRVWCKTADYWTVYHDMLEQLKANFDRKGITMAFPTYNILTSGK